MEQELKRRKWWHPLVNQRLQINYLKFVALSIFVSNIIICLSFYMNFYLFKKLTALTSYELAVLDHLFLGKMGFYFILEIAAFVILGAILSLFISQKVAGPLYRIKKEILKLVEGKENLNRIHLRKGDELEDLANLINRLIEKTQR